MELIFVQIAERVEIVRIVEVTMREGETFDQMLERHRKIYDEEHSIRCPFCGHERYPKGDCEG